MYGMKGPSEVMLSQVEKRALAILGPSFKKRPSYSFSEYAHRPLSPTEIQLEEEEGDEINNLSSEERVNDSVSRNYEDGDGDNANQSSNDPLRRITNLYQKWLIDVEKKRADAELSRAQAEEKRAVVAAKAAEAAVMQAEAAVMQAEALKTLAEATSNQAYALMRIAMVLESRLDRNGFSI